MRIVSQMFVKPLRYSEDQRMVTEELGQHGGQLPVGHLEV